MGGNIAALALSCGDPAGIGPEIVVQSWQRRREARLAPFFLCGSRALFRALTDCPVTEITSAQDAAAVFDDALPMLDIGIETGPFEPGIASLDSARFALASLDRAIDECLAGRASGIVTAPVSKATLYQVGFPMGGQTEYIGDKSGAGADASVMMLAGPSLRVIPVTIHIALAEVPDALTQSLIERVARTVDSALRNDFGLTAPRLAMAGLNPHAGEDGTMGREEIEVIAPTLETLRSEGIDIDGPTPADSLFHGPVRSRYDAILCPTHDQALIPIKALHFDEAVNVTLGLPVIRTSPDHGTAFDLAGRGLANPGSMIAAIRMAGEIAQQRLTSRSKV